MVIKRAKHQSKFTVMPNAIFTTSTLSAEACGLLAYFLTKPPRWRIDVAEVQRRFGIGRDKVYRILTELQQAGYARRLTPRESDGRFARPDYLISDTPLPENPDTDKPDTDKPDTENTDAGVNIDTPVRTDIPKNRDGVRGCGRSGSKNDAGRDPNPLVEALRRVIPEDEDQ